MDSDDDVNPDDITVHVPTALDSDSDDDGDSTIQAPPSKGAGGVSKEAQSCLPSAPVQKKQTQTKKPSKDKYSDFITKVCGAGGDVFVYSFSC